MAEITHRQMRNDSAEVLRRVAAGETFVVTNNGEPTAMIGPVGGDTLAMLSARGQVRMAVAPASRLRSIRRKKAALSTAEILADSRADR